MADKDRDRARGLMQGEQGAMATIRAWCGGRPRAWWVANGMLPQSTGGTGGQGRSAVADRGRGQPVEGVVRQRSVACVRVCAVCACVCGRGGGHVQGSSSARSRALGKSVLFFFHFQTLNYCARVGPDEAICRASQV